MLRINRRPFHTFKLNGKGTTLAEALPTDIIAGARLEGQGRGWIVAAYPSGTPVAKYGSGLNALVEMLKVSRGGDAFKSYSPETLIFENELINKSRHTFRSTGSGTATDDPQTDAKLLAFGTDGQKINWREVFTIHFAYPWGSFEEQKRTMLRTTNVSRMTVEVKQHPYSNILDDGNTTDVTFSGDELYIDFEIVEYVGNEAVAFGCDMDYRQEELDQVISVASKGNIFKVPRLGALSSIIICTHAGDAGSSTTGTANPLSNDVITDIELTKGTTAGTERLVSKTFKKLQDEMVSIHQYNPPKSNGKADHDGFAGIFFHENGFRDLVDISQASASACDLTYATGNVSYTNKAKIKFLVNQIAAIKI